ncbi:MAG TPA: hypothetical protein VGQ23_02870 [Burkholderiaceae bacterium]|nr:hypothetical protein [Burkholderiaceae bacterium]
MRQGDLSLTVSQRRLACVLDPALALGQPLGPTLALRLTQVLEPWLTRSFWQVIDASDLLRRRAEQGDASCARHMPDDTALSAWIALRDGTDAGSWPLRWVGDNLPESQMKDAADAGVVERCELLTGALVDRAAVADAELMAWSEGLDPVLGAMDTLALSASLDGAMVLSLLPDDGVGDPWPVQALARAGLQAQRLEPMPERTLFAAERQLLRDALVSAGLAAMAESLPRLAVVHAVVDDDASPQGDPWDGARAWWYLV